MLTKLALKTLQEKNKNHFKTKNKLLQEFVYVFLQVFCLIFPNEKFAQKVTITTSLSDWISF